MNLDEKNIKTVLLFLKDKEEQDKDAVPGKEVAEHSERAR